MSRSALVLLAALLGGASLTAAAEDLSSYNGAELFHRFCASCHGANGEGNGPVAPFFKLQPPDLTEIARRSGGKFPEEHVRKIIDGTEALLPHGARQMPVWGMELGMAAGDTAEGRKQAAHSITLLVDYLKTIQKP